MRSNRRGGVAAGSELGEVKTEVAQLRQAGRHRGLESQWAVKRQVARPEGAVGEATLVLEEEGGRQALGVEVEDHAPEAEIPTTADLGSKERRVE